MASNGDIEPEDNELNESNGDKVVTMMDVLQEQEDFEEDANAVLGASDDKNCTYPLGYIKRQAIYACMTCCSEAKEDPSRRAGVCLACSLACHENHELIELYTKRNFRCDCGNSKFNSNPCQFTSEKIDLNEENCYNQNFSGIYCVCHRPYPDPEATEEDEMIQCIICEDWLHAAHLEATVPSAQYAEMICKECMSRNEFLHDYSGLALNSENDFIDVMNTSNDKIELCNGTETNENINTISDVGNCKTDIEVSDVNESKTEVNPPKESIGADGELNEGIENDVKMPQMETEVPMDEKLSNENMLTEAKDPMEDDAEKRDNVSTESSKIDHTTHNPTIKNCSEKNIDSHINDLKEIVESSEDSVGVNITSKENESKDCNPNTDIGEPKIDEDEQPKNAIPEEEQIKNEESKLDENVPTENAITGDNIEETIETNDKFTPIKIGAPESENENSKSTHGESVNDEKTDDDTIASTTDNIANKDSDDGGNIETTINDATIQTTTTLDQGKKESSNSEEELEKMEEDKLLADPEEKANEGNTSEGSIKQTLEENYDNKQLESNTQDEDRAEGTVTSTECGPMDTTSNDTKSSTMPESDVQNSENQINGTTGDDKSKTETSSIEGEDLNKENKKRLTESNNTNDATNPGNTVSIDTSMKVDSDEAEHSSDNVPIETSSDKHDIKRKLPANEPEDTETKKRKVDAVQCNRPNGSRRYKGATFWPSHFRQKLCTCNECLSMYKDLSILFLIDPEDTVSAYENLGKEKTNGKPASQYEKGLQALSSLDRIQQINVLTEYNKMRDKFLDFLKSFKDRRKIVTEEDVKAFFAGMKPKRRPDGVYFCR
ncbi:enolase-phosphatase E1 [Zerene cesonia]|uniref:enolase-phosphatase E1 n=1 Tax=Zerene cesonia TaxID=33412 RepID=UPI0018E54DD4|nr:enolase-phosphatase E1 [Zerene cesonia]